MKLMTSLGVLCCLILPVAAARAQHCPPIVESYLSQVSLQHDATDQALDLKLEYSKNGGQPKLKYQVYLLAYLEKNAHRVPAPLPEDLIDKQVVRVVHTQAIERNDGGTYELEWHPNTNELAKALIEIGRFTEKDQESPGGWGSFKDKFRLAVFIPFLEDRTYAILDGLPEDKHECNYTAERALLFQPLPYALSIHFGTVQGVRLTEGSYYIQINAAKPNQDRPNGP